MRGTNLFALIVAAVGVIVAGSASAQTLQFTNADYKKEMTAARVACAHSLTDMRCAAMQDRMLKAIAVKAASSPRLVSINEASDRQLEALIATIN